MAMELFDRAGPRPELTGRRRRPLVQGRHHLRGPRARLLRQRRRRHRRLRRADPEARLPAGPRRRRRSGCCRSTPRRCGTTATTSPTTRTFIPSYGTLRDFKHLPARGAQPRAPRDHGAGAEPHLGPAPAGSSGPGARPSRQQVARTSTSGATRRTSTGARASSSRTSRPRTGPGTRWRKPYYWHRFYSHQPDLNFDNPDVQRALFAGRRLLAGAWAWTACGWTPCRTCTSAKARAARTCRRPTRS